MGADGHIIILDAEIVEKCGFDPYYDFIHVYERSIFGRNIYTVYYDTERCSRTYDHYDCNDPDRHDIDEYEEKGCVIDEWNIWT